MPLIESLDCGMSLVIQPMAEPCLCQNFGVLDMKNFAFVPVAHTSKVSLSVLPVLAFPELKSDRSVVLMQAKHPQKGMLWDCDLTVPGGSVRFTVYLDTEPDFGHALIVDLLLETCNCLKSKNFKQYPDARIEILRFVADGVKYFPE